MTIYNIIILENSSYYISRFAYQICFKILINITYCIQNSNRNIFLIYINTNIHMHIIVNIYYYISEHNKHTFLSRRRSPPDS